MDLTALFLENAVGKTGLFPTIKIWEAATGTVVVAAGAMAELGDGFYRYAFATHDAAKAYIYRADSVTLLGDERYAYGDIPVDQSLAEIAGIPTTPLLAANYTAPDNTTIAAIAGYLDTEISAIITHLTDIKGAGWTNENLATVDSLLDTVLARLTVARAGYLDKLNVTGTLAGAVRTELETTQIPANIKKINDVTVSGAGTTLNPWGPI